MYIDILHTALKVIRGNMKKYTQNTPTDQTSAVSMYHAAVRYGEHTVWENGTLEIPQGSVTAIVGTNGAGKTTLLKAELGLVSLSQGSITVLGKPAGSANDHIGYVPQSYLAQMDATISAIESVLLGLTGTRFGWHPVRKKERMIALQALEFVGIAEYANTRLSKLSGGQRQRVAIAQALVSNPRMLILDEPLANLDLASQRATVQVLDKLNKELDMTIQVVAHDLNMLLPILTGAVYLLDGHPHYAALDQVMDATLLTHLYGTNVRVITTPQGDMFVTPSLEQNEKQDTHLPQELATMHYHNK